MLLAVKLVILRFAHNIGSTSNFMGNHKITYLTDNNMSYRLPITKITSVMTNIITAVILNVLSTQGTMLLVYLNTINGCFSNLKGEWTTYTYPSRSTIINYSSIPIVCNAMKPLKTKN